MSYVLYTIIALLIIVVIYGAWSRKQIYRDVDKMGIRKTELMNRPVPEELARVKEMRLSGETEERFEQWRGEWNQLLKVQFPYIEEKLVEVEETSNRYRFPKAQQELKGIKKALDEIERHIDSLIGEVHELVNSEETNRRESTELTAQYGELQKKLWEEKHSYGGAAGALEIEMEKAEKLFEEFSAQTERGDYFEAQSTLVNIREVLAGLGFMMEEVPERLSYVQQDLPEQIEELEAGMNEMAQNGFPVHLYADNDLSPILHERCRAAEASLHELQLEQAQEVVNQVEATISDLFDKLEQEALTRNDVEKEFTEQKRLLNAIPERLQQLVQEMEVIKLRYQLPPASEFEINEDFKRLKSLKVQFAAMEDAAALKRMTYVEVHNQLEVWKEDRAALEMNIDQSKANFDKLRQDELDAEDIIEEDGERITQVRRSLRRSSLPKIPDMTKEQVNEAERKLYYAVKLLDNLPIDMEGVRKAVADADQQTEHAERAVSKMLSDAATAERVVQYGNRYRTQNDKVNILLLQAEDRFRQGYYEEALELAVAGVEKVEKNVLTRIEEEDMK
ncbi:septation ring formation regulator EzrA [Alkalicoccus halolimnae]|uniref:Septation ring formation regulator EzrA n=1 Tax=Alkalicoccus halolimnae TaxID=1667239 RepID=A0AAJ8LTJ5_9BACI|nr:septation ring formation regulator EzrA [Alkalicoccus halolimnae]